MNDTWTQVLTSLTPDFPQLQEAFNEGPTPVCTLKRKGRTTILQLDEKWSFEEKYSLHYKSQEYGSYVEWVTNQLKNWEGVRRLSWDQWSFKKHNDAEKFVILFNLKWVK